jgi:hypothetical protein
MSIASAALGSSDSVDHAAPRPGRSARWVGYFMSGFITLFLLWDAAMKVSQHPMAVEGSAELGWSAGTVFALGVLQLVLLVLYLVPRTSVIGAVLWVGYLGGAIATHLRLGHPLLSHTLFPIYVAMFLWGGLWLRDLRVRALVRDAVARR